MAADHVEQQRRVAHVVGEGADLVERAGEGDQAVAADVAVGGLHADHTAQGGRLADRATGVAAQADRSEARGHRSSAATARATGHTGEVERVAGGAERAVLGARAHRELVEIGLADGHGTGGGQTGDHRGVVGRAPPVEDPRRARGGHATGAHVVLERHRHTGQRAGVAACGHRGVDGLGGLAGLLGGDQVERVHVVLAGSDGGEVRLEHIDSAHGARTHRCGDVGRGVREWGVAHPSSPTIGGTRKRWSSASGAAASTSSRSSPGRTTSGRSTLTNG